MADCVIDDVNAAQHALAAPLHGFWQWVHGPLAHWAQERPNAPALQNETLTLTYRELHERVIERSAHIVKTQAPEMLLLDGGLGTLDSIIEYLAIIHSGRCAAVADPEWPQSLHERIQACLPTAPWSAGPAKPTDAFYTGFTSGSTGLPKGFMRHHRSWTESFRVSLQDFGSVAAQRVLSPGRMSHSLFLFGVMHGLWCGAGAIVQEKFSALRCLRTLTQGQAPCLVAVPSQLLLMLQWTEQRGLPPIESVQLIMISGARWMRTQTPALQQLFPNARIVEFYGASEASFIAWMDAAVDAPPSAVGRPFSNVELSIRPPSHVTEQDPQDPQEPKEPESGLIFIRSPMLFIDYVGEQIDRTAVLRDGDWLSVRDMGWIDADGLLHLAGRESRMIVTRGKNLFPEELENLLQAHPAIARASVHGVADDLRGTQLHAVIQIRPHQALDAMQLAHWLRERTEAFKIPRQWWLSDEWPHTSSGKTDHRALSQCIAANLLKPWR